MGIQPFPPRPELPNETILQILHLCAGESYTAAVASLRLICKRWKPIVEEVLVRHVLFWDRVSAKKFTKWTRKRGNGSFVKTCTLRPSPLESVVQLRQYTTLLANCRDLRKLTIYHLYARSTLHLASHVPYLQELNILDPTICVPRRRFCRIFPFLSGMKFLKSLTLERIDFEDDEDDKLLTIGLACICLRDCTDNSNLVSSVFSFSRPTLRRYTFTSSSQDLRKRNLMPLPSFIDNQSCLSDLILVNYAHDSRCPAPVPGVTTLCILASRLVAVSQLEWAKVLLSTFSRVIVTNLDFAEGFERVSQVLWSRMKWLEVERSCFRSTLNFQRAVLPWGQFVRVLSMHGVWSVPTDFSVFPQLQALQLSRVSLDGEGGGNLADLQPGWLVPTLRVLSVVDKGLDKTNLCVIMDALSNQCPRLCCIIWSEIGKFPGKNKATDQLYSFCYTRNVEVTSAVTRFKDWARHFALNLT